MSVAIELKSVSKKYDNGTVGLKTTSLSLQFGSFYGMVGPNGAGKSTFVHLIAGVIRPTSGCVVRHIADNRELAWLSQTSSIDWFLPVYANVLLGARLAGLRGATACKQVDRCLALVGLANEAHKLPDQLSGGQQQRLQVGRAIAQQPRILLLDEPTTGLDPMASDDLVQHLKLLSDQGTCVVMVSHDLGLVQDSCDALLWTADAKISEDLSSMTRAIEVSSFRVYYDGHVDAGLVMKLEDHGINVTSQQPLEFQLGESSVLNDVLRTLTDKIEIRSIEPRAGLENIYRQRNAIC